MTSAEMVTDFKIRSDWYETPMGTFPTREMANDACKHVDFLPELNVTPKIEMARVEDLIDALNTFCGSLAEEYDFALAYDMRGPLTSRGCYESTATIPTDFRRLIAFAVEGSNEGYYVHVGALLPDSKYQEFGLAKTYSADSAYEMAKQASRFLAAALWN